jgi:hypothetical protein
MTDKWVGWRDNSYHNLDIFIDNLHSLGRIEEVDTKKKICKTFGDLILYCCENNKMETIRYAYDKLEKYLLGEKLNISNILIYGKYYNFYSNFDKFFTVENIELVKILYKYHSNKIYFYEFFTDKKIQLVRALYRHYMYTICDFNISYIYERQNYEVIKYIIYIYDTPLHFLKCIFECCCRSVNLEILDTLINTLLNRKDLYDSFFNSGIELCYYYKDFNVIKS